MYQINVWQNTKLKIWQVQIANGETYLTSQSFPTENDARTYANGARDAFKAAAMILEDVG